MVKKIYQEKLMTILIVTGEGKIEEKNKSLLSMIEEREETEGLTLS